MTQATITTLDPLKTRHREIWAKGDYPSVATNVIASLGPVLVEAAGIQRHTRVLDVAAGSGNVALPAARLGAEVVASDLTPALLAEGKRQAIAEGLDLDWCEGDAEDLPFASNAFDIVTSCVGIMFAPHHQASADELVRVTRPGGTIGLLSWTPSGFIGQMFATMKPFQAPPPPGVQPPPLWGDEQYVRSLFGDRVNFTSVTRESLEKHVRQTEECPRHQVHEPHTAPQPQGGLKRAHHLSGGNVLLRGGPGGGRRAATDGARV